MWTQNELKNSQKHSLTTAKSSSRSNVFVFKRGHRTSWRLKFPRCSLGHPFIRTPVGKATYLSTSVMTCSCTADDTTQGVEEKTVMVRGHQDGGRFSVKSDSKFSFVRNGRVRSKKNPTQHWGGLCCTGMTACSRAAYTSWTSYRP